MKRGDHLWSTGRSDRIGSCATCTAPGFVGVGVAGGAPSLTGPIAVPRSESFLGGLPVLSAARCACGLWTFSRSDAIAPRCGDLLVSPVDGGWSGGRATSSLSAAGRFRFGAWLTEWITPQTISGPRRLWPRQAPQGRRPAGQAVWTTAAGISTHCPNSRRSVQEGHSGDSGVRSAR